MQKKLDFDRPIFVIEHVNEVHWSNRYDPAKYKTYAANITAKINENCPGAVVLCNSVPKKWHEKQIYMQLIANDDDESDCYDMIARGGAFEISTVVEQGG